MRLLAIAAMVLFAGQAMAAPQLVVTACDDTSVPQGCVAIDLEGEGSFASTAFNISLPTPFVSIEIGAAVPDHVLSFVDNGDYLRVVIAPPFAIPIETFVAGEMALVCIEPGEFTCEPVGFFDWDLPLYYGSGYDVGDANGQDVPMANPPMLDGATFMPDDPAPARNACGLGFELALILPLLLAWRGR